MLSGSLPDPGQEGLLDRRGEDGAWRFGRSAVCSAAADLMLVDPAEAEAAQRGGTAASLR